MSTALATTEPKALDRDTVAKVLLSGDMAKLSDAQRMDYCTTVCESLGLNPLTQPFAFIPLNGKLVMYAKKDATEQLRKIHGVSITSISTQRVEDVFVVIATATDRSGRSDSSTGAVSLGTLKGEALANALMKAETKAKRRVTLSICGLGMLDETEVETIPQAVIIDAPKTIVTTAPPPSGYVWIERTVGREFGGDITVIDEHGTEMVYPVPDRQCFQLAEQIAQADPKVSVKLTLVKGSRSGVVKVKAIERWKSPEQLENERLDKELAAKAADVL